MKIILEAKNITKRFPGVIANDEICLRIQEGEIHGLIGENGAGKSTLLKILNGVYPSTSYEGEVLIDGQKVQFETPGDAQKAGIGFVPQEIAILGHQTVAANIFVSEPCLSHGLVSQRLMRQRALELMERTGIFLNVDLTANKLTVGQQQQLMILRALVTDPKILILDEPTTSLTLPDIDKLFETIKRLKNDGKSIILVTHKLSEIASVTDRCTILRDGHNVCVLNHEDYTEDIIIQSMIGRSVSNMYPAREFQIGSEVFRVEHLSLAHSLIEGRLVLDDVSFSLHKGEVLGISGLIGAGKSETLNSIFGRYKNTKGTYFINGEKVAIRSEREAMKNGISLVTEDRKKDGLLFQNSIMTNINVNNMRAVSHLGLVKTSREISRAKELFDKLRIKAHDIGIQVATLSGGNQQKVVVARALNRDPIILLLDEPTKGVDVGSKNEIYQLINKLAESGVSIIMASSDLPELLGMSDRFIVLANGKVTAEFSANEANEAKIMQASTR